MQLSNGGAVKEAWKETHGAPDTARKAGGNK